MWCRFQTTNTNEGVAELVDVTWWRKEVYIHEGGDKVPHSPQSPLDAVALITGSSPVPLTTITFGKIDQPAQSEDCAGFFWFPFCCFTYICAVRRIYGKSRHVQVPPLHAY